MATATTLDKDVPLYIGRLLEQWWAEFLAAEYVDHMKPACEVLFPYPWPMHIATEMFMEACSLDKDHMNFVCQALPCFGKAFIQKAVDAFPSLDEGKQTRIVPMYRQDGKRFGALPCAVSGPSIR